MKAGCASNRLRMMAKGLIADAAHRQESFRTSFHRWVKGETGGMHAPKRSVWLAWCAPLDIMTQTETERQALESLQEAVELWFESCISRNVLDEALVEAGFNRLQPGDAVPRSA